MSLTRLQQLFCAVETVEGTFTSTLFTSANGKYLAIDPQMTFEVESYQRDVARETFTPLSPVAGAVLGTTSFSLEAAGRTSGGLGTRPMFDIPLVACGFRRDRLYRFDVSGAITNGPIRHGTLITQTSGGATFTAIGTYYNGAPYVWATQGLIGAAGNLYLGSGTPGAGTAFTFPGSGSFTTSGSISETAIGWYPWSVPLYTLLFNVAQSFNKAHTIVGNTSKAIAISYYDMPASPATTQCIVRRVSGAFTAGETVSIYSETGVLLTSSAALAGSNQYLQADNVCRTASIGVAKDGVFESMAGCRGSVSITGNIGEPVLFNFTFQGIKNAVVDSGNVSGITYDTLVPPVLLGATVTAGDDAITTLGGQRTVCATSFGIDMAADVQYRRCMSASTGIDGIYQNGRVPTLTIDPEQAPELDFEFMANYFAGDSNRMNIDVGSTAANKFRFIMPTMTLQSIGQGDRNGIITRDVSFALNSGSSSSVSGDNEFAIIWDTGV